MNRPDTLEELFATVGKQEPFAPAYIAVSGNTGAGKSTLIRSISAQLQAEKILLLGVDERLFHHPSLPKMFSSPQIYALPIQMNFLIQRWLAIRALHEQSIPFFIERPHFDDWLFAREHRLRGNIDPDVHDCYASIANALDVMLPKPDLLILMNPSPDLSFARITAAEEAGQRPREFPNDREKRAWIESWFQHYEITHARYEASVETDLAVARLVVRIDAGAPLEHKLEIVAGHIRDILQNARKQGA
jgi:deoxyadenosine/deoxycytidine kinase